MDHCAEQLFQYLQRTIDIVRFSANQFNYGWEQAFRSQFQESLHRFEFVLERRVREWQEMRKAKTSSGFHYGSFRRAQHSGETSVQQALAYLRMEASTATLSGLRSSFRRLSKRTHPDHGGDPEEFRRLSAYKAIVESWLRRRRAN